MKASLPILNPLTAPGWDGILSTNERASFFHSAPWARVLADAYRFIPFYFTDCANDRLETLIPIMETPTIAGGRKGVSLPFTDCCAPIAPRGEAWRDIVEQVLDFGFSRGWRSWSLSGDDHFPDDVPVVRYFDHSIELCRDAQTVYHAFSKGTKSSIHKATKEGVVSSVSTTSQSITEFYRLHTLTRRRHGLPPPPFSFFSLIFRYVIASGQGFVALAALHDRPVAAAVFFLFGRKALYKFAASDPRYRHSCAGDLVMWEAIQWLCRNSFTELSLGKTEIANHGLRGFKAGWGAREGTMNYYTYNFARRSFVASERSTRVPFATLLKIMPLPLLHIAGKVLYRYNS
jgi:hypothetical protein